MSVATLGRPSWISSEYSDAVFEIQLVPFSGSREADVVSLLLTFSSYWSERGVIPLTLMFESPGPEEREGTFELAAETEQWMRRLMRESSRSSRISFSNHVIVSVDGLAIVGYIAFGEDGSDLGTLQPRRSRPISSWWGERSGRCQWQWRRRNLLRYRRLQGQLCRTS